MKAKKDNKTYRITTEQEKQRYLKEGYDIYNDEGNLVEYSPLKKVKYSEYDAVLKELKEKREENEALKAKLAELETNTAENKPASKKAGG